MPSLHHLLPCLATFAGALALLWSLLVRAVPSGRRRQRALREEDLSDWLLADIGWKDGRDTTARRMGRRYDRPRRQAF